VVARLRPRLFPTPDLHAANEKATEPARL